MGSTRPGKPLGWRRFFRLRLFKTIAVFLGSLWGLMEITGFVVERFRLTDNLVDMVGLAGLLMLPCVLLWGLREEREDNDFLDSRDFVAAVINGVLAAVVVGVVFAGQDLGRATDSVLVQSEDGDMEVVHVPRAGMLRTVTISPLRVTDPDAAPWLGLAASEMLVTDLRQNVALLAYETPGNDAGTSNDPGTLPLSRRQAHARRFRAEYFVDGQVSGGLEQAHLRITLYRTDPLRAVAELRSDGKSLADSIDALSVKLISQIDLPASRALESPDSPVESLLSYSHEALAAYFRAEYARWAQADLSEVREHFEQALALDPGFAAAAQRLAGIASRSGDSEGFMRFQEVAYRHRERFNETERCMTRIAWAAFNGQVEQVKQINQACVQRFPNHPDVLGTAVRIQLGYEDDIDGAIILAERAQALGGSMEAVALFLAQLQQRVGDFEGAKRTAQNYLQEYPHDELATTLLARLEERDGQVLSAKHRIREAIAHQDDSASLKAVLGHLLIRQGLADEALPLIESLESSVRAEDVRRALNLRLHQATTAKRMNEAMGLMEQFIAIDNSTTAAMWQLAMLQRHVEYIEPKVDFEVLDHLIAEVFSGEDEWGMAQRESRRALLALLIGSAAELRRGITAMGDFIDTYGIDSLRFLQELLQARLAYVEGEFDLAVERFEQAHRSYLRADGGETLSEQIVLQHWLEAATDARNHSTGQIPSTLLANVYPADPHAVLLRAQFAAATGDQAGALALAREAVERCLQCDSGHWLKQRTHDFLQAIQHE